jgi:hypothetical protein
MPKPRKLQIAVTETPYYHLVSRCVRRAFLCGITETYNFEHRRQWIAQRLTLLTKMFAIDIAEKQATHIFEIAAEATTKRP